MDERNWTDRPLDTAMTIGPVQVSLGAPPAAALLISGDLTAALHATAPNAPTLGLLEDARGALTHAIRIGRHSALLICDTPPDITPGWHAAGFALSDASDAYALFHITGQANGLLAQGGVPMPHTASPSAALLFAGLTCLVVRNGPATCLWVPRAHTAYISSFLRGMSPLPLD